MKNLGDQMDRDKIRANRPEEICLETWERLIDEHIKARNGLIRWGAIMAILAFALLVFSM